MANNKNKKDNKVRFLFKNRETQVNVVKYLLMNQRIPFWFRFDVQCFFVGCLKSTLSKVQIVNRCISTGRSRGVLRFYKLSRIQVREFIGKNLIFGLRRSIW